MSILADVHDIAVAEKRLAGEAGLVLAELVKANASGDRLATAAEKIATELTTLNDLLLKIVKKLAPEIVGIVVEPGEPTPH